ncbi:hypothetical protein FN846DRAFT_912676 [Sphaerosporella brunnea]|uniref:Uncharacterized protein n=1 Tax=Sphaerosporella brunnea TaxID=1250544 RepID=A0A5J5EG00_9PEZI|nr:hypothetical protein FN846DRAFT_912676 [Sphaerosporella brunnea]
MSHLPTQHDSHSASSIHDIIATFLRRRSIDEVDLVLHVEHDGYLSWPTTGLLAICSRLLITYSYDPATCALRIRSDSYKAPPGQSPQWPAWRRPLDAVSHFRCRVSTPCRRAQGVVFEVGFAESYEELVEDAFQWLLMEPGVQLVVLIKVHEDRTSCTSTPESQQRIEEYIWRFGNRRARTLLKAKPEFAGRDISVREEPLGPPCDSDSDMIYDEIVETARPDDWVGPMSAFVEFWRLREGKPDVDGVRMSVLPHLHVNNPIIYIILLLPSQERCDRKVSFDLAEYERVLEHVIQHLATGRAFDQCRLRPPREPITADVLLKEYNISDNASQTGETQGAYKEMDSGNGDGDGAVAA